MGLIFYTYTRVIKVLWRIDKSIAWDETEPAKEGNLNRVSSYNLKKKTSNAGLSTSSSITRVNLITTSNLNASSCVSHNVNGEISSSTTNKLAVMSPSANASTTYTFSNSNNNGNKNAKGQHANYTMASGSSMAKTKMKNQLIARRKAAKMLISVAVLFAICYLPIHLLNFMRYNLLIRSIWSL